MKGLLNWTGNLLFFLMFLTVMENLLPGKKYNRYIRLFAGMVLILLAAEPLARGLNLEDRMAYYFESISLQQDVRDLSKEILGIEEQRLEQVMVHYEQAVETDLSAMAEDMGYVPVWTQVTIEKDRMSRAYGTVVHIEMRVEPCGRQEEGGDTAVQAVSPVEPVTVSLQGREEGLIEPVAGESEEQPVSQPGSRASQPEVQSGQEAGSLPGQSGQANPGRSQSNPGQDQTEATAGQLNQLRRKVERYYGLETGEVEIQFLGK